MSNRAPSVLVVEERPQGAAHLAEWLKRGFDCSTVTSLRDAQQTLQNGEFDLVLSRSQLQDGSGRSLIPLLAGKPTTLYIAFPAHDTCWWLSAVLDGRECFGSGALRPSEFMGVLDHLVERRKVR